MLDGQRERFDDDGVDRCEKAMAAQREILIWLQHFRNSSDGLASELLDGTRAALVEAASYLAVGFGRSAVMSIRTQVDLLLSYTFFADHPREWQRLGDRDEGFMLRSDMLKYHVEMYPGFKARLNCVENHNGTLVESYRTMSAHVHAQSAFTTPAAASPIDLLASKAFLDSVVQLQAAVQIRLSDYFVALYAHQWQDLPDAPVERVRKLLTKPQLGVFFPTA